MGSYITDQFSFSVGLMTGLLAFWLGKWRATCIFWNLTSPANVPPVWRLVWVRICTWVLVTAFSLIHATLWAGLVVEYTNDWLGLFSWGGWMFLRWHASALAAGYRYDKEKTKFEELNGVPITDINVERLRAFDAHTLAQTERGTGASPEKSSLSLVIYYTIYFLGPLTITILPPTQGTWWVLKIIGGLLTFSLIGGYLRRLDVANGLLGDAAGGFIYLAICYSIALVFRDSAIGAFMFLLSGYLVCTLYPMVLKRQRQRRG